MLVYIRTSEIRECSATSTRPGQIKGWNNKHAALRLGTSITKESGVPSSELTL
jgi:hypothetical protein